MMPRTRQLVEMNGLRMMPRTRHLGVMTDLRMMPRTRHLGVMTDLRMMPRTRQLVEMNGLRMIPGQDIWWRWLTLEWCPGQAHCRTVRRGWWDRSWTSPGSQIQRTPPKEYLNLGRKHEVRKVSEFCFNQNQNARLEWIFHGCNQSLKEKSQLHLFWKNLLFLSTETASQS